MIRNWSWWIWQGLLKRKGLPLLPFILELVSKVTLAALIGLSVPEAEFDGRCLDLDAGPGNTCGSHVR